MKLQDISDTLYYTKKKAANRDRPLASHHSNLDRDWEHNIKKPPRSRYLLLLTLITFIFLLIAIGVAYYVRISGTDRIVSSNKIAIVTRGHHITEIGKPIPLTIEITNNNPVSIQQVVLTVLYPSGAYQQGTAESVAPLLQKEFLWDFIQSGETVEQKINPIFYGMNHQKKSIQYTLKYVPENSRQSMEILQQYEVSLNAAPLSITRIEHTNSVVGKPTTFTFTVRQNTVGSAPRAYVELNYPPGFTPTRFSRKPFNQTKTRFLVPNLRLDSEWKFSVTGDIRGDEGVDQTIAANIFVIPTGTRGQPVSVDKKHSVFEVNKSFLDIALEMYQEGDDFHIVSPGEYINIGINWSNTDTAQLEDLVITASLSGSGLNESSIETGNGYFDEIQRQVVWDKKQVPSFAEIETGETGALRIRFRALPDRVEFAQPNKFIQVRVSAEAKRTSISQIEHIKDIAVGTIHLRSVLQIAENATYSDGELKNEGPLPPQVGKRTTYSLIYFIKNSGNELSDVTLNIPLPRNVTLTGKVSGLRPDRFVHDEETNTVTVTMPSIAATGPESSETIEIQIEVTPQSQDAGDFITLTKKGSYTAYDTHTKETFKGTLKSLDTDVLSKGTFSRVHKGRVIESE